MSPDPQKVRQIATEQRQYALDAISQATLQDVAGMIEGLVDLQVAGMPDISRHYSFSVTDQQRCIDRSVVPTMPWIAFVVCNDGPSPVYVDVNESVNMREQPVVNDQNNKYSPVGVAEEFRFDMKRPGIRKVFLQCDTGNTSVVRIFAEAKKATTIETLEIVQGELAGDVDR